MNSLPRKGMGWSLLEWQIFHCRIFISLPFSFPPGPIWKKPSVWLAGGSSPSPGREVTPRAPAPFISPPAQGIPTQMMERVKEGKESTGTDVLGDLVPHLGSLEHKEGNFLPLQPVLSCFCYSTCVTAKVRLRNLK